MIISVVSPHCSNNGNTITSIFTALGLAELKKSVLLTHTSTRTDVYYEYFGLRSFEDKTNTPTQLVKLMRDDAIKVEDIGDYCKTISENCDVFTNNTKTFTDDDMKTLISCLIEDNKYDFMVVDIDETDLSKEVPSLVIQNSDIIMINLTQNVNELLQFNREREKYMRLFRDKKIIVVCNMYSSTAWSAKDFSKKLGFKTAISNIHYNNWIRWGCNNGRLMDVYKFIKLRDTRVIELSNDIFRLASSVNRARIAKIRQGRAKGGGVV